MSIDTTIPYPSNPHFNAVNTADPDPPHSRYDDDFVVDSRLEDNLQSYPSHPHSDIIEPLYVDAINTGESNHLHSKDQNTADVNMQSADNMPSDSSCPHSDVVDTVESDHHRSKDPHDFAVGSTSIGNMPTCHSSPHLDVKNSGKFDYLQSKNQYEKTGGISNLNTCKKRERDNTEDTMGCFDWKSLKWTRSGSLSLRGPGLSHSGITKSIGGDNANEANVEFQSKTLNPIQPSSAEPLREELRVPDEETTSRKKRRLGWGEGLAKYEKKEIKGPDDREGDIEAAISSSNLEHKPTHSIFPSLADNIPRISDFPSCPPPETSTSAHHSSSTGNQNVNYFF